MSIYEKLIEVIAMSGVKQSPASFSQKSSVNRIGFFWRAAYGEHNLEIRQWAAELGYRHIGWTSGRSARD